MVINKQFIKENYLKSELNHYFFRTKHVSIISQPNFTY